MIIRYGKHTVNKADIKAVEKVLREDFLTHVSMWKIFKCT